MSSQTSPPPLSEDLEFWLSIITDNLLPNYTDTLQAMEQLQLDKNIAKLMMYVPKKTYKNKELANIFSYLAHNLVAHMKQSEQEILWAEMELTQTKSCITQLEMEIRKQLEEKEEEDPSMAEVEKLKRVMTELQIEADH